MKFQYRTEPLSNREQIFGTKLLRPIIPITLTSKRQGPVFEYEALVDSGADFCIFEAEVGKYFDLDIPSGKPIRFSGVQVNTGADAYLHDITLGIGDYTYQTTVAFSDHMSPEGHGILGQHGFFDHFFVGFNFQKEYIELKPK